MSTSIKDVDFSFEAAAKERDQARLRNPHRTTVASHNPDGKPRKAPWKVITGPAEQSAWTVERPAGKPAVFTENRPSSSLQVIDRITGNPSTSFYKMRIVEACILAGQCAEVGDLVSRKILFVG